MSAVWQVSVDAPSEEAFEIAEKLGFLDAQDALAVSLIEPQGQSQAHMTVQALYATESEARSAQKIVGGDVTPLEDQDWVAQTQSGLAPVPAGRFFVHGSHDTDNIPSETEFPILIDAGMAFGTGHHGTTKGCLIIFDTLLQSGHTPETILDLGCGAGILAIAAAKALPKSEILASDIDKDAIDVTDENAHLNHVSNGIRAFQADGFDAAELSGRQFELIFANILAGPLMGLAADIYAAAQSGGHVILSGILTEQAETVAATFEAAGFEVTPKITLNEWTSLLAVKP